MSADVFYESIVAEIFTAFGGKESVAEESQRLIRRAVELSVENIIDERRIYPQDENAVGWIIQGKTLAYLRMLSLKESIPIIGYREIPVLLELSRRIDPKKVKVALIQIGLGENVYVKHDTRTGLLFHLSDPSKVSQIILATLRGKISEDVDFVCLPELSVPSDESFIGELHNFARERKMVIISGSFHDLDLRANISLVITPGRERYAQHKICGSDEYGEGLGAQVYSVVKIFDAGSVRFAVLICSDAISGPVVNLLTFKSRKCLGVDIVFNPSHTRAVEKIHNELRHLCSKVLSFVAFVNSEHGGSVIFTPKKMSKDNSLMCGQPTCPSQDYEVKVLEFTVNVDDLRDYRHTYYGITKPEECYVLPS